MVLFDSDEPVQSIVSYAGAERTTLTQFFYMNCLENEIGTEACNLTYQDFPYNFVWHKDTKTWTKRQKGFSLGLWSFPSQLCFWRIWIHSKTLSEDANLSRKLVLSEWQLPNYRTANLRLQFQITVIPATYGEHSSDSWTARSLLIYHRHGH